MTQTVQIEAISPDDLAVLVRNSIEDRMDLHLYQCALEAEEKEKEKLLAFMSRFEKKAER